MLNRVRLDPPFSFVVVLVRQIDSVAIEDFEENSNDGVLLVTVTSLGTDATENAGYTVSVGQCDDGIVVGGAHVLSLAVSRRHCAVNSCALI